MPPDLQSLRHQLREQFPDAHLPPPPESLSLLGPLPDFPKGAITELSPAGPASGLSLILAELLNSPESAALSSPITNNERVRHSPSDDGGSPVTPIALIDGRDSFDPASYGPDACSRLLWIRCHHAEESLRCADLLLRDGNLPLLTLDLQLNPLHELNDIPTSSWHRLRNLARQSGTTLLTFTPRPLIPAASLKLTITSTFHLQDLETPTDQLSVTAYQDQPRTLQSAVGSELSPLITNNG